MKNELISEIHLEVNFLRTILDIGIVSSSISQSFKYSLYNVYSSKKWRGVTKVGGKIVSKAEVDGADKRYWLSANWRKPLSGNG